MSSSEPQKSICVFIGLLKQYRLVPYSLRTYRKQTAKKRDFFQISWNNLNTIVKGRGGDN